MLEGSFTKDSLGSLLRSVSHDKRNGQLSLSIDEETLTLLLSEGKIIGVESTSESAAVAICQRLVSAGRLIEKVVTLVKEANVSVVQLQKLLQDKGYVDAEQFARAKYAYELDLLHSLGDCVSGNVSFSPKLIRGNEDD